MGEDWERKERERERERARDRESEREKEREKERRKETQGGFSQKCLSVKKRSKKNQLNGGVCHLNPGVYLERSHKRRVISRVNLSRRSVY